MKVPRGTSFNKGEINMFPALVDLSLAVLILLAAGFLGVVGLSLVRELKKGKDDDSKKSN